MELSNDSKNANQHNNELTILESDAQETSNDKEIHLASLTRATTFIFELAMVMLARDLAGSNELEEELASLKRSLRRLQKCQEGHIIPAKNSDDSSDEGEGSTTYPKVEGKWQSEKGKTLYRISGILMSRLMAPLTWTEKPFPRLQAVRQFIKETEAGGGDIVMDYLLTAPLTASDNGKDHIWPIALNLGAATIHLMKLQYEGYSNPGVDECL
ncbi:hypothetical protein CABS01_14477 [Colletotrichum abscissum]|uniref:Uncharacterized protein n=1 Tax=Colletotrichum abscissum TaxID=1671311 RepID=A0A9P9XH16_9PEZI|nr:uncharacterized protein CABS01_14477 [Colletotrichum abscissum]KAI3553326.1 hypothetical protein CABS02_06467 [Colletotrichum abscissum]KAK1480339.1 hypothetical protein CABS01_14477 [Colletotrichum abscissum]